MRDTYIVADGDVRVDNYTKSAMPKRNVLSQLNFIRKDGAKNKVIKGLQEFRWNYPTTPVAEG
ncbi:hypothetical protein [Arthrobacter jinronghuae]|uniref:hypothetical protein n=1 Tax=Arthrobacter jinronghuae TaxID=2964609 RepID=UPI002102A123|nr:hypothetical protein [Arthrobacter jinronghuae]UWX79536.1 hypothetical protein N2K98_04870 [Arthrobacter jinronghuae]